jgi:hypothetical protein
MTNERDISRFTKLIVFERVTERGTIDLTAQNYQIIEFDMEKDGHKGSRDIYDAWLRENPSVARIDNPSFFIGRNATLSEIDLID